MAWFKRSLLAKLLAGMLVSAVIPFFLSNLISYKTTSDSVERQVIELSQNAMAVSMDNLKRYLQDLNRVSVSFYYDETLMSNLRMAKTTPLQTLYITNQVENLSFTRPEFRAVRYVSALSGQTFTKIENTQLGINVEIPPIGPPNPKAVGGNGNFTYEAAILNHKRVLAMHNQLIDYPSPQVLGTLSIYVGLDEIERLIRTEPSSDNAVFLYLQDDLKLLYNSEDPNADAKQDSSFQAGLAGNRGSFNGELHGQKGVYIYLKDGYMNLPLTLVQFVPAAAINESANRTLHRSLLIQVFAIVFVIVFASFLSYLQIAPVKRLLRRIARVEIGDFDVEEGTQREDELGVLESRFLTMIRNLDDLMNREYRNRLELSTAQLKMLQAQINPHFLYNTLQSIGTLALRHGVEEIHDKIGELGAILRYSMDLKTETVTVQTEIRHIEHYLSLQTGRFKNKLSYTLSCANEAMHVRVPKMILQPLVENSIVHGFEKGRGSGTLHISIELSEAVLVIRVIDNGKGIDAETVERIRQEYKVSELHYGEEGGIGLINVLQRLRLSFGSGFEWEIQSDPYEKTVIELRIDLETGEQA